MQESHTEQRKSIRENLRLPIRIALDDPNHRGNTALAYSLNISNQGLGLLFHSDIPFLNDKEVKIFIDSHKSGEIYPIPGKLKWYGQFHGGIQFQNEIPFIEKLLQNAKHPLLKSFYPYINGEDIDTGRYEYFHYAEKAITFPHRVRTYKNKINQGERPEDLNAYFYAQYALANTALHHQAVLSAYQAFKEFQTVSIERRKKLLTDFQKILMEKKENLVNLMIYEGHPRQLAEREIASMILQLAPESLEYFTKGMIQSFGQQGKATLLTVRRPYGVMGVIAPRYASTLSFMACLALLAGNTLIINPSLQAPIACIYLWREILVKALTINQLPKGVVNIVADHSAPFMEAWLNSPYIHSILFFGDSQANLENGKKPILKLSGNDYLLVWKDAPLEPATESLLDGFMGSTQMCMIPKKALIHEDIFSPFVEMFLRKVKRIKPGLPSDPETILSPVTRIEDYFESLKDALEHGAKLLSGGYRMNHEGKIDPDGLFIAPTVLQVPFHQINSTKCMLHENFFPLLPLVKIPAQALTTQAKDRDIFNKMLQTIERHEPGLRTSVWIKDRLYLKKFLEQTQSSGFLRINSRHIDFSPLLCSRDQNEKSCSYYETLNHLWHRTSHLQWVNITHPNHLNN